MSLIGSQTTEPGLISDADLTEEQLRAIEAFKTWYYNGMKHGFGKRPVWKLGGHYVAIATIGVGAVTVAIIRIAETSRCQGSVMSRESW